MLGSFLQVAIGGAIGSALRFGVGLAAARHATGPLPLGILTVNVLGSLLMGVLAIWTVERGLTHLNPLLLTGLLGGFTTFSAFSLESFDLIERGLLGTAALYVLLSVVLSLAGLALGVTLARAAFA